MSEAYGGRKFKTRFAEKKILDYTEADELITASLELKKLGLLKGIAGNLSVRHAGGFLITAGGVDKARLSSRHVVEVLGYDKASEVVYVSGLEEPSSEARMHFMIYKNFPKVNAVVHVHDKLVLDNPREAKSHGAVFTRSELPYGTEELARDVVNALKKSNYVVMANHGSVSAGSSLKEAVGLVVRFHGIFS